MLRSRAVSAECESRRNARNDVQRLGPVDAEENVASLPATGATRVGAGGELGRRSGRRDDLTQPALADRVAVAVEADEDEQGVGDEARRWRRERFGGDDRVDLNRCAIRLVTLRLHAQEP